MKDLALLLLAPLSALVFLGSFAFGMNLWLTPTEGPVFIGAGTEFGWLIFALGNMVSWVMNLLCWLALDRPRRFGWIVALQGVPGVATLVVLLIAFR